jgi:DNA-binding winged helix-turn-helix (wHTH) protein
VSRDFTTRFGPFTLDAGQRRLARDGRDVHLTPKAFDLLMLLATEAPRVLPKAELHERLWPGTFVSDATLVGLVKELRRALDDYDAEQPIIRTMHRVGYGFACEITRLVEGRSASGSWHWLVGLDRRYPLHDGENVIGRDPDSSVWLDATSVSRRHARISVADSGATLEDLGSKNGTRIGEEAVAASVALRDGDRIVIGNVPLTYRVSTSGLSTETQARPLPNEPRPKRVR